VTVYELATAMNKGDKFTSRMELVKDGGHWLVDRLPLSADNQGS
jgi:hypothetical protein